MTAPQANPAPRPASREEFAARLREFINDELPRLHPEIKASPGVDLSTPLFATGLIDSMAILHLVAFVEKNMGREISTQEVVMKHFQNIQAITDTFWPPAPAT